MLTKLIPSLKAQLLAQRTSLRGQLVSLRGGNVGRAEASAEHFGHTEESTAQTNTERELEFALDAHESAELRLVDEALSRMEAGTYGACIDCGTDIPPERLKAAPDAARCIACQEKVE